MPDMLKWRISLSIGLILLFAACSARRFTLYTSLADRAIGWSDKLFGRNLDSGMPGRQLESLGYFFWKIPPGYPASSVER